MRVRRIPGVLGYAKASRDGLFYVCVGCSSCGMGVKRGGIRIFTVDGTSSISHRPRAVKLEDNVEKTVEYHMGLPYTVELKCYGEKFRASIRELPACTATVDATDSIEKLWQLLEKNQREWIEQEIEMGREVPEPPGATRDPFWETFEEGNPNYDEYEVRWMLYDYGASRFPLRVLEDLWLQELEGVRLSKVESSGAPPKAETNHHDQTTPWALRLS